MTRLFGYVLLISLALGGAIVIACLYVAMWLVAIIIGAATVAARFLSGQRGDELWRGPFTTRLKIKIPRAVSQARYSNRR